MKKAITILFALALSLPAAAQHTHDHHDGHSDHDHDGHDHDHSSHNHAIDPFELPGEGHGSVSHSFTGVAPRFGLAWQGGFFAEAGLSLDFYRLGYTGASEYVTFGYRNLRPYVSGEILIDGRKLLGGGKAGLEFIMATPLLGMALGADGSYYTDGRDYAATITPRLMLSDRKSVV
jgi:hypothetical protein